MILPKIVLPSTLQSNITSVTEPHYDAISLSGISIGVILLAINENIIDEACFIEAQQSKEKLTALANQCAKALNSLVHSLFDKDNYNCMTLKFQTFENNAAYIGDNEAQMGFRLQLDSLLVFNLSMNDDIPESLKLLAQKLSIHLSHTLSALNSFDCYEPSYETEQWEHLIESAAKLKQTPDFTLYQILFNNDSLYEEESDFEAFKKTMLWYESSYKKGGIKHNEATSLAQHLAIISAQDMAHPAYEKLVAIYHQLNDTVKAKDIFENSVISGYEEETYPCIHGMLALGGFANEENYLGQHVDELNGVGEEMIDIFTPNAPKALSNSVRYLNKLCSLSKLCDEALVSHTLDIRF